MPSVLSPEQSARFIDRIDRHFREHGFGLCAAELRRDGRFIGFVGLSVPSFNAHFTPCVEIGWRLAADYWGCGFATEGATAMAAYAFRILGIASLVSFTVPTNTKSRRVMEKIGMTHNSADDFDHPGLPVGHPLRPHVLYRLECASWKPDSGWDHPGIEKN